jgi:NADPH2:quinone reductase
MPSLRLNSYALTAADCAPILEALRPGFEEGMLRPYPVAEDGYYPLEKANEAYRAVLTGAPGRIAFSP